MHAGPPSTASYKTSIKEDSLIEVMEYLIDNIYIKVGNKVFRHQVEIPMGTDCTPLLGLDKLCSKCYLLFFSFMLKMSTYRYTKQYDVRLRFSSTTQLPDMPSKIICCY